MKFIRYIWQLYLELAVARVVKDATTETANQGNVRSMIRFGLFWVGVFTIWALVDIINLQYYKSLLFYLDLLYGTIFWPVFWISTGIIGSHYKGHAGIQLLMLLIGIILIGGVLPSITHIDFFTFMRLFMAMNFVFLVFTLNQVYKTIFQRMKDGTIIIPEGD